MSLENKVIWAEGMFLRPQHFQQQDRFWESCSRHTLSSFVGFNWGFTELRLDDTALRMGQVVVRQAQGVLPDGMVFQIADEDGTGVALDVPATIKESQICLALPPSRSAGESVIFDEDLASSARYLAATREVKDGNAQGGGAAEIQIGVPRFRLMLASDVPHGWMSMGVAWLLEKQANNTCILDEDYIPPMLRCGADGVLSAYLREAIALLNQRGDLLAERMTLGGKRATSEVGDFLLLKVINRWQPVLQHLERLHILHPERLYLELLGLVGDLATFSSTSKRPPALAPYIHDDLSSSFRPLMLELRRALALVLDQTVVRIELQDRKYGIKTAFIPDASLLKTASFILAVHANLPAEQVQAQFPTQAKVGPVEKIRDLVNLHLPGIVLKPLPVAPRELPYNSGYNYFEIDTKHFLWSELDKSAAMAMHIAGDFPGLDLECWAIRK